MPFPCEHCGNILKTIASLNVHLKSNKRCLSKRHIQIDGDYECKNCDDKFLVKSVYDSHILPCNKKYEIISLRKNDILQKNTIKNLSEELEKLREKNNIIRDDTIKNLSEELEKLCEKYSTMFEEHVRLRDKYDKVIERMTESALSKTTINKINNVDNTLNINTFNRTDDEIKDIYENNLTVNHIIGGISSIASLIVDKVIKDDEGIPMITFTDKSRGTAKYKLPTGELVVDSGFNKFTSKNRNLIMKKVYKIAQEGNNCSQILDTDTTLSKGYNQIIDDNDGGQLKRKIINSV